MLDLIAGADLVIYDATYTDEEFDRFHGWGHSTWQEGVRLCEAAGAGGWWRSTTTPTTTTRRWTGSAPRWSGAAPARWSPGKVW